MNTGMPYRRLGRTGLRLSVVSLGTWATVGERLDDAESIALLHEAYQSGINFIDGAETYADGASETATGRALAELAWPRETYVVSGKVFYGVNRGRPNTCGLSRKHVFEGCHATLRRLRLDYLDLFLCHRADPDTPIQETVVAMSDLVTQGKVLYWGTSEWTPEQVAEAHAIATERGAHPPVIEQVQYNLLHRHRVERDFAPLARQLGLGITTWSPLAHGLLAGRYDSGVRDGRLAMDGYRWLRREVFGDGEEATLERCRRFTALARDIGVTPSSLALAWVLRNPVVTSAICGASNPAQLRQSLVAVDLSDQLDQDLLRRIDQTLADGAIRPAKGA